MLKHLQMAVALMVVLAGAVGGQVAVAGGAVFTSTQTVTIPEGDCRFPGPVQAPSVPYGSPVQVELGSGVRVRNVTVSLQGLHYRPVRDLRALVVAPGGEAVLLMHGAGSVRSDADPAIDLTFDDAAVGDVPGPAASGTYRPTATGPGCFAVSADAPLPAPAPQAVPYARSLSALRGVDPNGAWRLYVVSTSRAAPVPVPSELAGWSLDITPASVPACANAGPVPVGHGAARAVKLACTDPDGDPMVLAIDRSPTHGTLSAIDAKDASVIYTPAAGFAGRDWFTYVATDADGRSTPARVDLHVADAPPASPPPVPTPPAPVPAQVSGPPVVTVLAPPSLRSPAAGRSLARTQMVHRLQFDQAGRYTFIHRNAQTGKRIRLLPGSHIGRRTLARASSAPVLVNTTPGRRLVVAARFASRALPVDPGQVELRVILKRRDGTLVDATVAPTGHLR